MTVETWDPMDSYPEDEEEADEYPSLLVLSSSTVSSSSSGITSPEEELLSEYEVFPTLEHFRETRHFAIKRSFSGQRRKVNHMIQSRADSSSTTSSREASATKRVIHNGHHDGILQKCGVTECGFPESLIDLSEEGRDRPSNLLAWIPRCGFFEACEPFVEEDWNNQVVIAVEVSFCVLYFVRGPGYRQSETH